MWHGLLPGLLCVCVGFLATRWLARVLDLGLQRRRGVSRAADASPLPSCFAGSLRLPYTAMLASRAAACRCSPSAAGSRSSAACSANEIARASANAQGAERHRRAERCCHTACICVPARWRGPTQAGNEALAGAADGTVLCSGTGFLHREHALRERARRVRTEGRAAEQLPCAACCCTCGSHSLVLCLRARMEKARQLACVPALRTRRLRGQKGKAPVSHAWGWRDGWRGATLALLQCAGSGRSCGAGMGGSAAGAERECRARRTVASSALGGRPSLRRYRCWSALHCSGACTAPPDAGAVQAQESENASGETCGGPCGQRG